MDLKSLEYDKVKCILEFRPINCWQNNSSYPIDIVCGVVPYFDYYVESNHLGNEFFVPCYKTIGKYDEDVYFCESVRSGELEIPGNDDRKKIPMRLYGKFLQAQKFYPAFYGYFNNTMEANRELIRKFKPWLEKTIVPQERIKSFPALYEKFKTMKFERPDL